VVECGDAGDGVAGPFTAAAALPEDPVVLEAGDGVCGAGATFAGSSVVPVAGDAPVGPVAG
jgi:hypothetical protein